MRFDASQVNLRTADFAGPVARAYELSRAPVSMIVGPTGGGKSTASARRCLRVASWQHPSPRDGIRKARIVCICPTYRRAWDTVMPSYFKVWPQTMGAFRGSRGDPADHIFDTQVTIGGELARVHVEVLFRAVNDMDVEEFFRGFEFTGFWLPEADTNTDLAAILSLGSNRAGRYPEPEDRPETADTLAWKGGFGDANAPIIGTHFYDRFYLKRMTATREAPATDRLFVQPSGYSPNAENLQNLRKIHPDYYGDMASNLDEYDIGRLIRNKPGYGRHGQPVHPDFDQDTHVAKRTLEVDPHSPVYIGIDAGSGALIPAATFSQRAYSGQWRTLAEIWLQEGQMGTQEFCTNIRRVMETRFARAKGAMICIDPAANDRSPVSEITTAQTIQHYTQIEVQFAPTNKSRYRRDAMKKLFRKSVGPKEPAKLIDPSCTGLIQGYAGGFHFAKRGASVAPEPAKNRFSHVCEADEYAALTIEGVGTAEDRFIRPDGDSSYDAPRGIYD